MVTIANLDFVLTGTPREREEMFPMQEQVIGAVTIRTLRLAPPSGTSQGNAEKPAADVFAERLAESGFGIAAPFLIP
jgi:hypothetical protein